MPINTDLTSKQWYRYAWVRDQGHTRYVEKHDKCERFFRGDQWDRADKARLAAVRRPALTINKIISTMANVMGEQIYNRSEISYQPRNGSNSKTADIISKVFKQISDNNQLDWKRSDMFADGIIGSRGYLDVRMQFNESLRGDVIIENLNPKNVLVDPDADKYDPDTWNEVTTTRWLTVDDIALFYSAKDAKLLEGKNESAFPYGYDSIDRIRDRFGDSGAYVGHMYGFMDDGTGVNKCIRIIERQYRKMDRVMHFVSPATGESRIVPGSWEPERIDFVKKHFNFITIKKMIQRIRWTVTADNVALHDDWSPYKHFTVIPYFPFFRRGETIGLVENLLDSQDLLNKASSQELHIVNTTANSGWKLKKGSLANMSIEELEERGAETGLVAELTGDPDKDMVKIQPNAVPQGLDRVSYKAEQNIKTISGVNDSMQGFDREDVAAKAIQQKKQSGVTSLVKPLDSLVRTDFILARNVLDLIQEFYSEERILTITKDSVTGETEDFKINEMSDTGEVLNDLMIGEYGVVVTSVPQRETTEDSEFDQLVSMRKEIGIRIPDKVIINASRLRNKQEIIKEMEGDKNSEQARKEAELAARAQEAAVSKEEGEASVKHEDAGLRRAKADQLRSETANPDGGTPGLDVHEVEREQGRKDVESQHGMGIDEEKLQIERDKADGELRIKAQAEADKAATERAARMMEAAKPAPDPASKTPA